MQAEKMLNWLCRYAVASAALLDEDRRLTTSLLDAGSGPHGFACAAPDAAFVGIDMSFPLPPAPHMAAIRNSPGPLPFADEAFGAVISLDVLEHVPRPARDGFVAELARVSAGQAIVACPSSEMAPIDDLVRTIFQRYRLPVPGWLSEHDEHVLPTPAEIQAHCAAHAGFRARELPVPNGVLSTMAALVDFTPETAPAAVADATRHTARWLELFETAVFGDSWRKAYVLERAEAQQPLVDPDDPAGTWMAALRCPRCAASLAHVSESVLRCTGCEHLAVRDRWGIWDLRSHKRALWVEPDWQPSVLAPLLHGFADLDHRDTSLVLRARPHEISGDDALACAGEALGGRELPEHVDVVVLADHLAADDEARRRTEAVVVAPGMFA